jgi:branched-chain amino acid transport system substrate-binding protein
MKRLTIFAIAFMVILGLAISANAAEKPILVGFPMYLSGPGAVFGKPCAVGAEMLVKEVNDAGGVLGRPIKLLVRDVKGSPEEATRVAKEMILKDNVEFLVGGLTSSQGLALSEVSKQEEILYIAPISKVAAMCEPPRLHKYVFRSATNSKTEGRSGAVLAGAKGWNRIATIGPDYSYGHSVTGAFIPWVKKLNPKVEIVHQAWPKLGEKDYTPFINVILASKPEAVFSTLWGGHFITFAKQARDYGFFEKFAFVSAGEAGCLEAIKGAGDDMPLGIISNAYDTFYYPDTAWHKDWVARLSAYTGEKYPTSWAGTGYDAMKFLTEAIKKAGKTDTDAVIQALEGLVIDSSAGKLTMRAKDHQANRGQYWGTVAKVADYPFPILKPVQYIEATKLME